MPEPHFLNVDLEIHSSSDLSPVIEAFGQSAFVLHREAEDNSQMAALELEADTEGPDETILRFCQLIEEFSPKARDAWDSLEEAIFDVGYDESPDQKCSRFTLRAETLEKVAAVGASMAVSIYKPREFET